MTSYKYSDKTIFVLGAPRSGTSWLAKIFDAHPDTLYRHEPDIVRRGELPFMPDAKQVEQYRAAAEAWLNELAEIRRLKCVGTAPVFRKSYLSSGQSMRRWAAIATLKMSQNLPLLHRAANSIDVPDHVDIASPACKKLVIKSVSAMGRAGLLAAASPDSRFVVIIRHPCGQVESMLRGVHWSLFEEDIPVDDLAKTSQARRRNLSPAGLAKASFAVRLAWSWVIQNEAALEALKSARHVKVVRYIELAERPAETARELFEFCGLDWQPSVADFIGTSTRGTGREHYYQIKRDPIDAATKWRKQLSPTEIEEVTGVAIQSEPGRMFLESTPEPEVMRS